MQKLNPSRSSVPANATRRFDAFVVEEYQGSDGADKANWIRVGVAFENKDGKGYNVQLSAVPVSGKLVLRLHEPKED